MKISIIAAIANHNVIGNNNAIPWYLPADLTWFKKHTLNKPVIMGRLTWQSLTKPLLGRHNIIISKSLTKNSITNNETKISFVSSIKLAINLALALNYQEIMVIGGENIYRQMLNFADNLYLTYINLEVEGDTYFPNICRKEWISIFKQFHSADYKNNYSYSFEIFQRIKKIVKVMAPLTGFEPVTYGLTVRRSTN